MPCQVHLIERRSAFGKGLAYSTGNPDLLLNVRTGRMSAFEDDPEHFLRWLSEQGDTGAADPAAFVSRVLYGRYIRAILDEQLCRKKENISLNLLSGEAERLAFDEEQATIALAGGQSLNVDAVILAVGNFPPDSPDALEGLRGSARYIADPWNEPLLDAISPQAPVLVIGTGLTMVDFVLSLFGRGHRGPILAISRRGLLPHWHDAVSAPAPWHDLSRPVGLSQLLRQTRKKVERDDWRAVIDGMRPHLPHWWQEMSVIERRRFLRHLRPWWDIHRHRLAPQVGEQLDLALETGRLRVAAGQIVAVEAAVDGLRVVYRSRGGEERCRVEVGYIVNCSGPASDFSRISQPLIRNLLDDGMVRPDPLQLGLDVDDDLRLLGRRGQPNSRLFALGPVTKGHFWEATAVPEIRRQAEWLAKQMTERVLGEAGENSFAKSPGACPDVQAPSWFSAR
jgi:uncharacterized NAD(P)/FAD-binding protein YdhS